MTLQPFAPRDRDLGGASALFEHRAEAEVDIEPCDHLLCVNFQPQPDAVYAYAGAPAWHGTRHAGMAHLIEPGHRITGHVPHGTDHVVLTLGRGWLAELALRSLDAARFELVSDGVPYRDGTLERLCGLVRDELVGPADVLMLDALTTAVGVHLLRTTSDLGGTRAPHRAGLPPRKLAMVKERIEADLAGGVRLAELAALVGMSPDHLWRCFREETGLTPHQWQTRRRIERVMAALADPRVGLAEASLAAGFSSQSHMTRAFRRHTGTTPARWRRERA